MNLSSRTTSHIALSGLLVLANACSGAAPLEKKPEGHTNAMSMANELTALNNRLLMTLKPAVENNNCISIPMDENRTQLHCTSLGKTFSLTAQSSLQIGCAISNSSDEKLFKNTSIFFTPDSLPKDIRIFSGLSICENNMCVGEPSTDDDMMRVLSSAIDVCDTLTAVLSH